MTSETETRHPVEELAEEYANRLRRGEKPTIHEYQEKFPHLAEEIRAAFGALQIMEKAVAGMMQPTASPRQAGSLGCPPERLGEFRIIREIGRGGMGIVYKAIQESLDRQVALKVLPSHALADNNQRERFLHEARAAAKLHHTNIVPVFAVGEHDGIHYFAMQCIHGRGLHQVIAEHRGRRSGDLPTADCSLLEANHTTSQTPTSQTADFGLQEIGRDSPTARCDEETGLRDETQAVSAPDPLGENSIVCFRSAARLGIQAAEALAYAHQQGILHRDIKPSNLMLDMTGVLWVMDFGLAKSEGMENLTASGAVVGTLQYLPPERFQGKGDKRSDVYSLGLTLYELLALQPAFNALDQHELLRQILHEEALRLRYVIPGIPRDLETIILKAIDKEPARRYQTAQEFADDLRRFVEDRPIVARRIQPWEHLWRWGRRNPMAAAFFLAVFLLVLGGSGAAVLYAFDRAERIAEQAMRQADEAKRIGRIEQKVALALQEAQTLQQKAWNLTHLPYLWEANLRGALSAIKRAEGILAAAPNSVDADLLQRLRNLKVRIDAEENDRQLVTRLRRVRGRMVGTVLKESRLTYFGADQYAAAFAEAGMKARQKTVPGAAAWIRHKRPPVRDALLVALHDWWRGQADGAERKWLRRVLDAADPDSWRAQVRAARSRGDRHMLQRLAERVKVSEQPPTSLGILAVGLEKVGLFEDAVNLKRRAQAEYPDDFWLNMQLGYALADASPTEAVVYYRIARALQPRSVYAANGVGCCLEEMGQLKEAVAMLKKATTFDPNYAPAHYNLGRIRAKQGDSAGAAAGYRQAIACDSTFREAYQNLAWLLKKRGEMRGALKVCQTAVAANPKDGRLHFTLGVDLQQHGDLSRAMAAYNKAIQCDPKIVKAHSNLGMLRRAYGDLPGSIASCRTAVKLDPKLGPGYSNLAYSLRDYGDLKGAEAVLRQAAARIPNDGAIHGQLGELLLQTGAFERARSALERALELLPDDAATRAYAMSHLRLCERLILIDKRLAEIASGRAKPRDVAELFQLADFCQRHKSWYATSARYYAQAFEKDSQPRGARLVAYQFLAAAASSRAATGLGKDAAQLDDAERMKLRAQAVGWLQGALGQLTADIERKQLFPGSAVDIVGRWQTDYRLAGIRDKEYLAKLTEAERQSCRQFWRKVNNFLKHARSGFREKIFTDNLLSDERAKKYPLQMMAGKTYRIDMKSTMFDALLHLQDAQGKTIAKDDDSGSGRNALITFTCKKAGAYRLAATSYKQRGVGRYTLRIREFVKN